MRQLSTLTIQNRTHLALGVLLFCCTPPSLSAQERITSWGDNNYALLSLTPVGADFVQVSAGSYHSLALRSDGSIAAWGVDDLTFLNLGQVTNTPVGTGFVQVEAGDLFSLALRADGSVAAWGIDNQNPIDYGQVTAAPGGAGYTQLSAGVFHSIALHTDGSLTSWGVNNQGSNDNGQVTNTPSGTDFIHVAAGDYFSLALHADGSIAAWGSNNAGQVSNAPAGTGFVQLAGGWNHALGLRADGTITSWGANNYNQVSHTPAGAGFVQVAAGHSYSVALHSNGSIVTWGLDNVLGLVTNSPTESVFTQIAAGNSHSVALSNMDPGTSICFGDGTGMPCPCGWDGDAGEGCANVMYGWGASLAAFGEARVSADTFLIAVGGLNGTQPGLLLRGQNILNGGLGTPMGNGLLCTGGQTARSQVQSTSYTGMTLFKNFLGSPFGASSNVGVPTTYQYWYRNANNTCSGQGFNFSNAWIVTWSL